MSDVTNPVTDVDPEALADGWIAAWNAHDLDRIMEHYDPDVTFTSPIVAKLGPSFDGTLYSASRLRSYVRAVLRRHPDLHFDLLGTFVGVDSITVVYRNHRGSFAAETMFHVDGTVERGVAHYTRSLAGVR